jgi:glucan endo-1,3-alpha-glucosidase
LQFKDLDGSFWYRIGEMNFGQRLEQILSDQPDFVEVITWNDAGESHYVGNSWPEPIDGTDIPDYTDGMDHKGWLNVIGPAITALKAGATTSADIVPTGDAEVTGAFWYRPILTTTACPNGKPDGADNAQDAVNYAVLVAANSTGLAINISSGGSQIASESLSPGLNTNSIPSLVAGDVQVDIVDVSGSSVSSTTGPQPVNGDSADLCNYNYYVQGI